MCVLAEETAADAAAPTVETPAAGAESAVVETQKKVSVVDQAAAPVPAGDDREEGTADEGEDVDQDEDEDEEEEEFVDVAVWGDRGITFAADARLELCQLSKLLQCVRARDVRMIDNLASKGVPRLLDHAHPDNETVLGLAASRNDDTLLAHLLQLGADPNVADVTGRTAAMRACEYGHVQSMKVLAEAGMDMTLVDDTGQGQQQQLQHAPTV